MTGTTLEDLLLQADALISEALRETEARCGVLGHYIGECESRGSRNAAWSDAFTFSALASLPGAMTPFSSTIAVCFLLLAKSARLDQSINMTSRNVT